MSDVAFSTIIEKIETTYPDVLQRALLSYSHKYGLDSHIFSTTRLLDRGYCYSGVLRYLDQPDGTCAEHQFLTIPALGGVVPEKRHFRLLPNPQNPEDPWVVSGEEFVTVLCGVLTIVGEDVEKPLQINAGEEKLSYGCYCDREKQVIRWFQDRHALQADAPWTTMIFCHRYTTLSSLEDWLGPQHYDLLELRSRGVSSLSGKETK